MGRNASRGGSRGGSRGRGAARAAASARAAAPPRPALPPKPPQVNPDVSAHAVKQYGLIVGMKDAILAGKHASIKPTRSNLQAAGSDRTHAADTPAFHPTSLDKSDEVVKAEVLAQRKRVERAMREEVDHQRRSAKSAQSQAKQHLDLSAVLTQAQKMAAEAAAAQQALAAANNEAASDSFDNNTFYSSSFGTPKSFASSRNRRPSEDAPSQQAPPVSQVRNVENPTQPLTDTISSGPKQPEKHAAKNAASSYPNAAAGANKSAASNSTAVRPSLTDRPSQSGNVQSSSAQHFPGPRANEASVLPKQTGAPVRPNPTYAPKTTLPPQSAQVAPAAARAYGQETVAPPAAAPPAAGAVATGAIIGGAIVGGPSGTTPQVAALRVQPSSASSPDNSSQGGWLSSQRAGSQRGGSQRGGSQRGGSQRGGGQRGGKKRKAGRQVPENDRTPIIKDEPRSPSPLRASSLRPNKRRRQFQSQPVINLENQPPRYSRPVVHGLAGEYPPRESAPDRVAWSSGGLEAPSQRPPMGNSFGDAAGYGRDYVDHRRLAPESHVPGYGVANALSLPYSPGMAYAPRPLSSAYSDAYRDPRGRYLDYPEEQARLNARPPPNGLMAGHARPGILVDGLGREYLDSAHPAVQRPTTTVPEPGEPHLLYERLPRRAPSRHAVPLDAYAESDVVYRGAPAPFSMPRRVVTQPSPVEYAPFDYRDVRQREYFALPPPAPARDFLEVGRPQDRPFAPHEAPAGGARPPMRASSMLPLDAMGPGYARGRSERMQSVRPDVDVPAMGPAAYANNRPSVQPYLEDVPPQRPYDGPYHPPPPQPPPMRGTAEIAFIERPRGATQEIVYADDARREIYR